jgi:probable HAF family extracellular repeat protein
MRNAIFLIGATVVLYVFTSSAIAVTRYRVIDIGDLPGGDDRGSAEGINSLGHVVGGGATISPDGESVGHAFLWTSIWDRRVEI